jgi:NAD(P)H-hydrate epimerase
MQKVLTAAQMREVDRLTTEKYGIPSILLMENAAHAVARVITEKLGGSVKGKSILILCGKGNNGGDGAALGWKLALAGAGVEIILFGKVEDVRGDARINFDAAIHEVDWLREIESREEWDAWFYQSWQDWDVVVDAVFGTGLNRPIDVWLGNVVRHINIVNEADHTPPRIAVSIDIPSGLNSDSAEVIGECFQADYTVTFTKPKPGNVIAPASSFGGQLIVEEIGSRQELVNEFRSDLFVAELDDARNWLIDTDFNHDSFKNKRGHALLIAGSENYSGAAVLAGNAAMRSGVGLVTVVTPKSSKESIATRLIPEVMVRGVAETEKGAISFEAFDEIDDLLEKADSVAIGCGLSQDASTKEFVRKVVENRQQPTVVDADALNLLSPFAGFAANGERDAPLILTPHEGEFMRLLGTDDKDAIKDRVAAVREFSQKYNVILVLKGERVLIGEPGGKVVVNPTGNAGLGKAGNGDTLTGIIAGFAGQAVQMKIDMFETVVAAVYLAGLAGDIAEKKYSKRVMTASDVRECLVEAFESVGE